MKKKTLIIYSLVSFVFVGILFFSFLYSRQIRPSEPLPVIKINAVPTLDTNPEYGSQPKAVFQYDGPTVSFPTSLPIYIYEDSRSSEQVSSFAQKIGFSEKPTEPATGALRWIDSGESLMYDSQNRFVAFSSSPDSGKKSRISDINVLFSFLKEQKLFPPDLSVQSGSTFIPHGEEGTTQSSYSTTEYRYLLDNGFPLIFDTINSSAAMVHTISPYGIFSFNIHFPPTKITKGGERRVFSLQDILALLEAGKGGLVSAYNPNSSDYSIRPQYASVSIRQIQIYYLLTKEENMLVPVFRVNGFGTGVSSPQTVEYFLRATN